MEAFGQLFSQWLLWTFINVNISHHAYLRHISWPLQSHLQAQATHDGCGGWREGRPANICSLIPSTIINMKAMYIIVTTTKQKHNYCVCTQSTKKILLWCALGKNVGMHTVHKNAPRCMSMQCITICLLTLDVACTE